MGNMETEKEKNACRKNFMTESDPEIVEMRKRATKLFRKINSSNATEDEIKNAISKLIGKYTTVANNCSSILLRLWNQYSSW